MKNIFMKNSQRHIELSWNRPFFCGGSIERMRINSGDMEV